MAGSFSAETGQSGGSSPNSQPFRARRIVATYPDHLRADLGHGLVLGEGNVRKQRAVADDGRVRVALDVGAPLPAGRVGVAGTNVLGLEALELLLVTELVGLGALSASLLRPLPLKETYHGDEIAAIDWGTMAMKMRDNTVRV